MVFGLSLYAIVAERSSGDKNFRDWFMETSLQYVATRIRTWAGLLETSTFREITGERSNRTPTPRHSSQLGQDTKHYVIK